jgi:hypothetical protein
VVEEPTPPAGRSRVGAAVQLAVVRHVGQRVDVGADVRPGDDQVVGGRPAVGADHVAMSPWQRVRELWVVRRLGHTDEHRPGQVDDADTLVDGVKQQIGHAMVPASRSRASSST